MHPDCGDPGGETPARARILTAAEELFAESGFQATPTSRIAERAGVPKGLVHYYFRRKLDLLKALIERLPVEPVACDRLVVPGDVTASLGRLIAELDRAHASSAALSHLLWREADTHPAVRDALHAHFERVIGQVREVLAGALGPRAHRSAIDAVASLVASTISYRHAVARHSSSAPHGLDQELQFLAHALTATEAS